MAGRSTLFRVTRVWGVLLGLYTVLYAARIVGFLGVHIADMQNSAIMLGAVLVNTLLLVPPARGMAKDRWRWYDVLLAIGSIASCGYIVYFYALPPAVLTMRLVFATNLEIVLGLILIAAIFEAGRRTSGLSMVVIGAIFLLYFFFAKLAPGFFQGYSVDLPRGFAMLYLSTEGIWGTPMSVAATIIVIFLIFGQFLDEGGAGKFFTTLASALLGHVRGGPAKVAVIGSGLFGMISGSTAAGVATVGAVTIPLMKSLGYRAEFAGAVEAVSANGGQIMPPVMGAVAFVMAEWLGLPYWEICVSSFVPAFLYYFVEFIQVDREAAKLGLFGLPRKSLPPVWRTLKGGYYFLIPPLVLVVLLAVFGYSPQTSAIYSLGILLLLGLVRREGRNVKWVARGLEGGARGMNVVVPSCAVAGVIIASVVLTGLGFKFSGSLVTLAGGNLFILLLLTAAACFILGMGMVALVCYIILVVLVAPALIKMGVLPLAAHLFVFWWGITAFITPPVAVGAFVAAGIAGSDPWKVGWQAVRLGIVTFIIPFVFVYNPALLLKGSPGDLVLGISSVLIAGFALACGISGYLFKRTTWVERLLLLAGAGLLLVNDYRSVIAGLLVLAVPFLSQRRRKAGDAEQGPGP